MSTTAPHEDSLEESSEQEPGPRPETESRGLARFDQWAASDPFFPRSAPWCLYLLFLTAVTYGRESSAVLTIPLKLLQAGCVCGLIWRWRSLVPELNWKFHWSVIPVSAGLTWGWIFLHHQMAAQFPVLADSEPNFYATLSETRPALFWPAAVAHLVAMCTAVPMIEETFNRSLLQRCLSGGRATWLGFLQFLIDLPLVGSWIERTSVGVGAKKHGAVFGPQFLQTPLGQLSVSGVTASTAVFCLVHAVRDWPGAVLCGVTWCIMLNRTRHLGLGPVVWSHALVNLLLWIYVISFRDWQLL